MAPVTWLMVRLICPAMPARGFGVPGREVVPPELLLEDEEPEEDEEPDDEEEPDEPVGDEPAEDDEPDVEPAGLLPERLPRVPEDLPFEPLEWPAEPDPPLCDEPELPSPECGVAIATAALGPPTNKVTLIRLDAAASRRCMVTGSSPPSRSGLAVSYRSFTQWRLLFRK